MEKVLDEKEDGVAGSGRKDRLTFRRYMRLRAPPIPASMSSGDGMAQQLFLLSFFMHHERGRVSGTLRRWIRSFTMAFRNGIVGVFCPCWGWRFDEEPEEAEEPEEEESSELRRAFVASLFHGRHDRRTYHSRV